MRSRVVTVVVLLAGLLLAGCERKSETLSPGGQILAGEHQLRKMYMRTDVNAQISGGYFLFLGSVAGSAKTELTVKFAWKMNDGTYAISSLPLEKIRIKFDEKATAPTIKFRWTPACCHRWKVQELMDRKVIYALLTVREADWPVEVNLPLNSQ